MQACSQSARFAVSSLKITVTLIPSEMQGDDTQKRRMSHSLLPAGTLMLACQLQLALAPLCTAATPDHCWHPRDNTVS